jgi:hypothetical protein
VFHKQTGKWQAQVGHNGSTLYCGLHDTPEAAATAAHQKRVEMNFLSEANT